MKNINNIFILGVILAMSIHGTVAGGKKILMVIAEKGFRDEELLVPQKEFVKNGLNVIVASTSAGEAVGKISARVKPDAELSRVNFSDYDAIVVVGGPGSSEYLWDNKVLRKGLVEMQAKGKVVTAICISTVVLARAGVLKGKKATVFPDPEGISELKKAGAIYVNQHVITDGKIVTGDGPDAALEFARAVIKLLK
ncbi:hypothetical protein COY52_03200 [Candidatus Desantisbacteria bacterium CG_4_10_14_0_8_um_filter_48_22]|uniref:DJ-1/PfpI domain-containing protein n=1 Tax=Candidatus Desantisbacteria bacterium CG_4_10_14_0_8_um_filter_48_22 TaxID=1974543 RepID=A0A2M7SDV3_9BACT|nr:MAG: hypothetical protein AUJ67_06205 [Candidatus Desantisbacteria bacterium CG1_02_49_89]PIZ17698.1 MAG: hypothetical protein COY52_03200 [Candidatus Desantisbacteria bacterium CG_4_10_14_0_8_um_filter_48_22]